MHYKYGPAACNETAASAGAVSTASAGMGHMIHTQALLKQLTAQCTIRVLKTSLLDISHYQVSPTNPHPVTGVGIGR